jgi:hypothetical protein
VLVDLQPGAAAQRRGVKLFTLFPEVHNAAHFLELDNSGAPTVRWKCAWTSGLLYVATLGASLESSLGCMLLNWI